MNRFKLVAAMCAVGVVGLVGFAGCDKSTSNPTVSESQLVGTWNHISDITTTVTRTTGLPDSTKSDTTKYATGTAFAVIGANHLLTEYSPATDTVKGTWSLSGNQVTAIITVGTLIDTSVANVSISGNDLTLFTDTTMSSTYMGLTLSTSVHTSMLFTKP